MCTETKIDYLPEKGFEELLENDKKISVLLFMKKISGNSQLVEIILSKLASKFIEQLNIYKLDLDSSHPIFKKYSTEIFPTICFVYKDEILHRFEGTVSQKELSAKIFSLMKSIKENTYTNSN